MSSSQLHLRKLGRNGPLVPALGLGLMGLSASVYGTRPSDEESFKLLDYAVELGATFWDTSDIYGEGEEMLGRWFRESGKRDKIFLASKFGLLMDGLKMLGVDSTAEYCKKACESSLSKLSVDTIDLFYAHRVNPSTPIEETMHALAELQREGKIRHIGLCGVSSSALRRAYAIAPVAAIQATYSPFVRSIEGPDGTDLLSTCRELGVAVVSSSPLGRGLFTGAFTTKDSVNGEGDVRANQMPWWSDENLPTNAKIVKRLETFADKKQCTVAQLTLAWILKQGDDVFAIPGTKKAKNLEENWNALEVSLSDEEEAEVRDFVESIELAGFRSMPEARALSYVDTIKEA